MSECICLFPHFIFMRTMEGLFQDVFSGYSSGMALDFFYLIVAMLAALPAISQSYCFCPLHHKLCFLSLTEVQGHLE